MLNRLFILLIGIAFVGCSQKQDNYQGDYVAGKKHGWGQLRTENGVYYGQFTNDSINGIGKYERKDGGGYIGQWLNKKWSGVGEAIWKTGEWEGDKCIGEFKNHEINGLAFYTYKVGTEHFGYYKNGKAHGVGIRKWKNDKWNGDYYFGEWIDGEINGHGKYYDASNGVVKEGVFSINGTIEEGEFSKQDSVDIMNQLHMKWEELEIKFIAIKRELESRNIDAK